MDYAIKSRKLVSQVNQPNISGLILAAYISLQRLNRSKYQLEQIIADHPKKSIRQQAQVFLQKNKKLASIATDLINRLKNFSKSTNLETDNPKSIQYLSLVKTEMDLLDDMHFKVAKSYSRFIYENYEAVIISMNHSKLGKATAE